MNYSGLKVTYSYPRLTYSDPKVTHSDPTHHPLPPPASTVNCLAISEAKLNFWWVGGGGGGGGGGKVATNFNVSSWQGFKL